MAVGTATAYIRFWPYRFLMNDLINGCGLSEMWVWLLSLGCCANTSHAQTEFCRCNTMASRSSSELELPDCPSQPTGINFSKRSFTGK